MSSIMSLIYNGNNNGPKTVPCGTQDKTGAHSDFAPLTTTLCCLEQKNDSVQRRVSYQNSLHLRSSWGWVSNIPSKSKINVSTWPPLSKILALPTDFHNCVFSWMRVAYRTRDCVFQGDPWCLNILCAQVICREYMLMRQDDNCLP